MGQLVFRKILCAAVAVLLLPSIAVAAGLGRLSVLSSLGEPLRAEIEIVSLQPDEADALSARLAPQEAFRQANIEINSTLYDVRFAIERRPSGQYVLALTSIRPMNEPYLDMLVELSWATGRLIREYTFLLDPPEYKGPAVAAPTPAVTPPAIQALAPEPAKPAAPVAEEKPAAPAVAEPVGTYEVKRGDTLAKIARAHLPQGVTLQQMLVALYRGNEEAFIGNNMNRLRTGRILNIPHTDAVLTLAPEDARRLVNTQSAEYAAYQRSIGAAVAAAPARPEPTRQAVGRVAPPAPEKPAVAKAAPKDQLRLSKPDDAKAPGKARAAAGDDLVAKDKALKEAQERVAMLEKNVQDLQKLLQLKSAPAAQLQQQAEATKAAAAPAKPEAPKAEAAKAPQPAAKAEAAKADVGKAPSPPAEAPKAAAPAEKAAPAPDAAKAAAPEPGKAPDVAKAAPKPAPKAAPPPPPPPPPSFIDELLENTLVIGGVALVLVLLLAYGAYSWRKKKAAQAQFASSLMAAAAGPGAAEAMPGAAAGTKVEPTAFPAEVSPAAAAKAEAEEIDPVAEADVYMAYGRDAQAEEILKEALGKDAGRTAVRLKLLEIYANRKDAKTFEKAALELQAATGGQGEDWEKAVALGQQVDPANPLYGGTGEPRAGDTQVLTAAAGAGLAMGAAAPDVVLEAAAEEKTAAPALDFDLDLGAAPAAAQPEVKPDEGVTATAQAEQPAALDFDLDLGGGPGKTDVAPAAEPAVAAPAQAAEAEGASIDFDLGTGGAEPAVPAPEVAAAPAPVTPGGAEIEFDLDLGTGKEAPGAAEAASPQGPEIDLSAISLDLGGEAKQPAQVDAKWQEVATKLDLAKAYQEMGDKDGARGLLDEVIKEGDAAQQQQAKTMLEALG